ncbi:DUF1173 domain-containing protein [Acidovorax sp. LjRoot118]|uniref:DUF1173 family protein n=1 Tax=Acidovorax sp. LjRoot118 TaxID=3342256 RepID=UPI003ECC86C5
MQTVQSTASKVLLNGKLVEAGSLRHTPQQHQADLERIRVVHGHALCHCKPPGLRLLVKRRGPLLHVAVWPGEAHMHRADCPFFNEQAHYTGRPGTVSKTDEHPERPPKAYNSARNQNSDHPEAASYDIWSLIHHLWESSRLHSWVPGWHRDWTMARHVLLHSAGSTHIDGVALADILYVPPMFSKERRGEIEALWAKFARPLWEQPRGGEPVASGFILGLVKEIAPTAAGHVLRLKQHGPAILLGRALSDNLTRMSRRGWAAATHPEPGAAVVALVRVEALRDRSIVAADCVLMRTTSRLIPSNCNAEDSIADQLIDTSREFSRPLSYAQASNELPTFVLRDSGKTLTEMYIFGTGMPAHQLLKRTETLLVEAPRRNTKLWIWARRNDPHPPALPEIDRRAR